MEFFLNHKFEPLKGSDGILLFYSFTFSRVSVTSSDINTRKISPVIKYFSDI